MAVDEVLYKLAYKKNFGQRHLLAEKILPAPLSSNAVVKEESLPAIRVAGRYPGLSRLKKPCLPREVRCVLPHRGKSVSEIFGTVFIRVHSWLILSCLCAFVAN